MAIRFMSRVAMVTTTSRPKLRCRCAPAIIECTRTECPGLYAIDRKSALTSAMRAIRSGELPRGGDTSQSTTGDSLDEATASVIVFTAGPFRFPGTRPSTKQQPPLLLMGEGWSLPRTPIRG